MNVGAEDVDGAVSIDVGHARRAERLAHADGGRARHERQHEHVERRSPSRSPTPASRRPACASPMGSTRPRGRRRPTGPATSQNGDGRRHDLDGRPLRQRRVVRRRQRPHRPAGARHLLQHRASRSRPGCASRRRRRTSPCSASGRQPVGRADDLDRPRRRALPPDARRARFGDYLDSGRTPTVGQWEHVAATYDGTTARFYVDGVEVASRTFTGNGRQLEHVAARRLRDAAPSGFFDGRDRQRPRLRPGAQRGRGRSSTWLADPARDDPAGRDRDDAGERRCGRQRRHDADRAVQRADEGEHDHDETFQLKDAADGVVPATVTLRLGDDDREADAAERARLRRELHRDGQGRRRRRHRRSPATRSPRA